MSWYIGMKLTRHIDQMPIKTKHLYATIDRHLWIDEAGGFNEMTGFNPWWFGPYFWIWGL